MAKNMSKRNILNGKNCEGIEELYDCVHRVVEVKGCTVEQAIIMVKFLKSVYKGDDAVRKICGVIPTTEEEIEADKKNQEDLAKFMALPKRLDSNRF